MYEDNLQVTNSSFQVNSKSDVSEHFLAWLTVKGGTVTVPVCVGWSAPAAAAAGGVR